MRTNCVLLSFSSFFVKHLQCKTTPSGLIYQGIGEVLPRIGYWLSSTVSCFPYLRTLYTDYIKVFKDFGPPIQPNTIFTALDSPINLKVSSAEFMAINRQRKLNLHGYSSNAIFVQPNSMKCISCTSQCYQKRPKQHG